MRCLTISIGDVAQSLWNCLWASSLYNKRCTFPIIQSNRASWFIILVLAKVEAPFYGNLCKVYAIPICQTGANDVRHSTLLFFASKVINFQIFLLVFRCDRDPDMILGVSLEQHYFPSSTVIYSFGIYWLRHVLLEWTPQ